MQSLRFRQLSFIPSSSLTLLFYQSCPLDGRLGCGFTSSVYFGQFDPFTKSVQPSKTFYSYFLSISFILSTGYQSIWQQSLPLSTLDMSTAGSWHFQCSCCSYNSAYHNCIFLNNSDPVYPGMHITGDLVWCSHCA